ncbi:probable serine/threonine-protein kinase PBL19 [Vigna radiata var. radiata]|uniref:Probable serine/threonine-protein kinase PBL19 n=1 Tax=Vigna radiata var. radiata TaxID=3916 RepID=A0A1S3VA66_VIGRR|nr:probable serine/threonine-protein kinase PBL19 [Vigna radiata var. radiata]XP_014515037.1 probable serine/threonine-protein kinase PBL19 [Vigna radiata var. radiata]XP_014515040.1 probable serine/threonine-protein kinase PBL19 [Vigna radiata var. radiata]
MKCFHYFRDKSRNGRQRSAPELKEKEQLDFSGAERVTKSSSSSASPRGIPELYEEKGQNLRVFSLSELKRATSDFNRLFKIGEGGFGSVFKGSIQPADGNGNPVVVAIKRLNKDALQGHKQWLTEVQFLGVVEHPNLVKLIGYCALDDERGIQRLLVYEYMPNKSLEFHLFNKAYDPLPWKTRLEIALGAAQGLTYLHEQLEIQVIYRDFKSSNILLDGDFKPKLSDFGLAREGPVAGDTHVSTAVMGTYGYAAPDYIETGHLTAKSDVWSFGVVLYEMLTGRRSMERNRPKSEKKLLEWVKQYPSDSKKFDTIIDQRLQGEYSKNGARKLAKLADHCLRKSAKDRPTMSQVVERLKQIMEDSDEADDRSVEVSENGQAEAEEKGNQLRSSELWKKRMEHLAKLGESVESAGRKRFMILHRANVSS